MLVGARVTAFTVSELFKEITEYTSLFLILWIVVFLKFLLNKL